jgi:hypothetical protein
MDETTQVNHTHDTCIDQTARAKNIQLLNAEKAELQKKYEYYQDMKNWYSESLEDILTTVKAQIDRLDSKLQKLY